jgi:beta-glucosidase
MIFLLNKKSIKAIQMKFATLSKLFLFLLIIFFSGMHIHAQSYLDKRINDLVDAMTPQEKINQLINSSFGGTPTNTRLGIPGFIMDDGPHGVRFADGRNGRTATAFPTGIAMASTWDQDIATKVGESMGIEFWAFNRNEQLGPCIDLCRDPRGGRSAESGGEDSYLAGNIGKSVAIGIQKSPIVATVKHFMGESKQSDRMNMNVIATDRWLMDFSGYNFRTVVQEAGVMSVMGAYNQINGDKCCESTALLNTNLRQRWGYPFYVVSDWGAIVNSQKALKAGTDICMGANNYANDLPGLVASGAVKTADLDNAVKRILRTKILSGMMDYFPVGNAGNAKTADINATNKLAAQKSIILLKNEKKNNGTPILPLQKTGIKIALIGPNATGANLNCYGSSETFPPYAVSVKDGLEAKIGATNVNYSVGCDVNSGDQTGFTAALAAAATADVVVFAGGLDATQEGEGYNSGADRNTGSIVLPGQQQLLIQKLAAVNPNIVVVIQSGGVCGMDYSLPYIKGFIYSFYAAQEAGTAISDVMFGDYNPAGRMPVTMPKKDSDLPSWVEDSFRMFTNNLDGGYRWFDEKNITPEFAFGFGLSYTTFAYRNLSVSDASVAGQPISVSADITNTGSLAGEEVAQLYISCPSSAEVWMPKKQLKGFKRIALQAGETQTVTFQLTAEDFYYWNGTQYQAQSGNFTLRVGGSSDNLPLTKVITLTDGEQRPDLKITQIYTMPRYPLQGQQVSFYALVKNQGNTANTAGSPFKIDYKINGVKVAGSDNITTSIAPGQVQLIASTGIWTCDQIGKTTLSGELAFNQGSSQEWDATNNIFSRAYEVFDPLLDPKISDLAYLKPVTVSSTTGTSTGSSIVDGGITTGWQSGNTDNESATIDLQAKAELQRVTIYWESNYAKTYKIESSVDGSTWTLLENITAGAGGTESYPIDSVQGRYIRITCLQRIPVNSVLNGFSIYEVVVTGTVLESLPDIQVAPVESQLYLPYAKTVLDGTLSGGAIVKENLSYQWSLVSGPADAVIVDPTSPLTLVKFKTVGTYVFQLTGTNDSGSNSKQVTITVLTPGTSSDLALMKPTICSGIESGTYSSDMAVDGNSTTRWSSAFQDNQWWQVDLQHQVVPNLINITWEAAYDKVFNIQISADNVNWFPLYSNLAFTGGVSSITNGNSLSGRYLKVNCVQRVTTYGSSFYSFNLSGSFITSTNHVPVANAGNSSLTTGDAVLNGNLSSDADNDPLVYKWVQLAGPSTSTILNPTAAFTQVTALKQGNYYFKLTVDDGKDVDFDVLKVVSNPTTKVNEVSDNGIIIYPNPVHDSFYIKNEGNQIIDKVQLFDMNGRLMKLIPVNSNKVSLNGISQGNYCIRLLSHGKICKVVQIIKK